RKLAWTTISPSAAGAGWPTAPIGARRRTTPCTGETSSGFVPRGSENARISRPMSNNVILVGFMGAGKSSVGRIVARRLGRCFVETDDMIVAKESMSIPEIFATKGEPYFRALEEDVVNLLALKSGDVIATGGGLPCRDGRPEVLRSLGTMVWLSG